MKQRARGFTLIELLVAISILAIVAVLGWRGLDAIVRARVSLNEDHLARLRLAELFLDTLCFNAHTTAADSRAW